ncbi:MAG: DNA-3-methyladenine glycosylase I [Pseudomonadota bacterium]
MTSFDSLYTLAAARKGGEEALEGLIPTPKKPASLARIPDDRWLSGIAKGVFRAGFNWRVVEKKWPGIEDVFEGFNPVWLAMQPDEELERFIKDERIIRHWKKVKAIRSNAQYLVDLAEEFGSAARYFAEFPSENYVDLLADMKSRGAFLGGVTGQYFLREMGKDSFILSRDVVAALSREKVFDGTPTSKTSRQSIQAAFNDWVDDGGQSLTRVSRVLAFTVG